MSQETGKYLIIGGIILLIAGIIVYFFHDQFKWFGNLPGDVKINSNNSRFYFPIVTMIIISIAITIIVNIIRRLF
ncbi:MAG TPA: DUF2905 domain-containing protein [Chitinophagaceae bacterium]|nr:DUF2905 domain-containing protein [Chitinophagaceae bacterium]